MGNNIKVRVVCAANRHMDGDIILGLRHWDNHMRKSCELLGLSTSPYAWEQGFLDSRNNFLTREEALVMANEADQMIREKFQPNILFSENIY